MRLPLQPKLRFNRQEVSEWKYTSGIYNGIVESGDTPYTTSRPKITQLKDASVLGVGSKGRGSYYWKKVDETYLVNDQNVYRSKYLTTLTGATLTTGDERVYFAEVGNYLCILDPQGNKGYYIDSAAPTVVVEITDVAFPPKQTPALQLAKGAVGLKGRLYVMDTDGTIWNSALEDPSTWSGGDNINAEIENDKGVYIAKHKNHILAFGDTTTEVFYHAGNPTNSPLSARQDIYFDVGCVDFSTVSEAGEYLYFVGKSKNGSRGVYRFSGFSLSKISEPDFDWYLSYDNISTQQQEQLVAATASIGGRDFYIVTVYANETYVYDSYSGYWYEWSFDEASVTALPVMAWADAEPSSQQSIGILRNGDLVQMLSDINTTGNDLVQFKVLTGHQDFESRKIKFMSDVTLDVTVTTADVEETSQTAQLRFYDNGENSSVGLPTHDIELLDRHVSSAGASNVLARAGSFRTRNFEITLPTDATRTRVELYSLEFNIREGL
jgi:hypothetical protein